MTRVTLENENGIYTVEIPGEELNLPTLLSDAIAPVLMAAGYSDQIVKDWLYS